MRTDLFTKRVAGKTGMSLFGVMSTVAVGTVLAATSVSAHAAVNYSRFNTVLGVTGVASPDGSEISYPLFRQDLTNLTISLDGGMTTYPAVPESVAVGYIGIREVATGTFFFTGAFPALTQELPALEATLEAAGLPITAVVSETAGLSTPVVTVHIEGTLTESAKALATSFKNALLTIQSPQLKTSVINVPSADVPNLPTPLPPRFQTLVDSGYFELLDSNALLFALPLQEKVPTMLGPITASPSLGFQNSVFISGYGYSVLNAELVLKPAQVQPISSMLVAAGFTISSQSDYYTDDSKRITFLHVVATSPDQNGFNAQGEALGLALAKIK